MQKRRAGKRLEPILGILALAVALSPTFVLANVDVRTPPDSAWLSSDPSGYPILTSYSMFRGETLELHMILSNASDTAHALMYPLYYDPDYLQLLQLTIDTNTFPNPPVWSFFENDTIMNDSGKVMLYAWTTLYEYGVPGGVHHIGLLKFLATDSTHTTIDTCWYPPEGHLYYTDGRDMVNYWPDWVPMDLEIIFINPDTAWLSLNPSGTPPVTSHSMTVGDSVTFHMILASNSDSAHAIMYPLYYDPNYLELVELKIDSSTFPTPAAWYFFERDTIMNDSGKVMLYAWTAVYDFGVPPGTHHIGWLELAATESTHTVIDTCWYPPEGHLLYTDGRDMINYWPWWQVVNLEVRFLNPDTAWLSLDPSGYPVLTQVEFFGGESKTLHMMMKNATADAHAIMYPLYYDTSALTLQHYCFDTSTFPTPAAWYFFEKDTIMNDSGKVFLYAWTATYDFGVPAGLNHIGTVTFAGTIPTTDSLVSVIDTCWYPPEGHLLYTNGPTATNYFPDWVPVTAIIFPGICGDADGDDSVTPADGFYILNYLGGGPPPVSCWAANTDGEDDITPADGFYLLNYLGAGPDLNCQPCE